MSRWSPPTRFTLSAVVVPGDEGAPSVVEGKCLDVRDRLAVHAGRAAVATHSLPGVREHVVAPHLVAQRVELEARSFLRFRM